VWATRFAEHCPPESRSLNRYGETFPAFLQQRFPHNPELFELARLDWDLRSRFDMADTAALDTALAAQLPPESWLQAQDTLHPTVVLRTIQTNVVALWQALDADTEVPPAQALDEPIGMVVWRRDQQPHFQTVSMAQWQFMHHLAAGDSLLHASDAMTAHAPLSAHTLGGWLQDALAQGWLRANVVTSPLQEPASRV
jgi:hypothetical protein